MTSNPDSAATDRKNCAGSWLWDWSAVRSSGTTSSSTAPSIDVAPPASALLVPVVLFIQLRIEDSPEFRRLQVRAADASAAIAGRRRHASFAHSPCMPNP